MRHLRRSPLLLFVFFVTLIISASSQRATAARLSDFQPYDYELRFTNPTCGEYLYADEVESFSGQDLKAKPQNAFCSANDLEIAGSRPESPLTKILEWIRDPKTKEVFFASLTFSNEKIADALCEEIEKRGLKVRFVIDRSTSQKLADKLTACRHESGEQAEKVLRGNERGLGFAHIKLILFNPEDSQEVKLAYGSGNLSQSLPIHHENWHFVRSSPQSHFVQKHLCLRKTYLNAADSKAVFRAALNECLAQISSPPEEDIFTYVAPTEGADAMKQIQKAVSEAAHISIAAHRFSAKSLIESLEARLDDSSRPFGLQLLFDDDLFWAGKWGRTVGSNNRGEAQRAGRLISKGAHHEYIESNHWERQYQHNKFLIFDFDASQDAVFAGAGNLTTAAFKDNFENFYFIQIPEVVEGFKRQYDYLMNLASSPEELPQRNLKPKLDVEGAAEEAEEAE